MEAHKEGARWGGRINAVPFMVNWNSGWQTWGEGAIEVCCSTCHLMWAHHLHHGLANPSLWDRKLASHSVCYVKLLWELFLLKHIILIVITVTKVIIIVIIMLHNPDRVRMIGAANVGRISLLNEMIKTIPVSPHVLWPNKERQFACQSSFLYAIWGQAQLDKTKRTRSYGATTCYVCNWERDPEKAKQS